MRFQPNVDPLSPAGRAPILSDVGRVKYAVVISLWLLCSGFFWLWWGQPSHVIGWGRYSLVTLCLFWIFFLQFYFIALFLRARKMAPVGPGGLPPQRVAMVVTKAPAEPFPVVRDTLEAMLAQDVAHDTWLADEDPEPATRAWCAEQGVRISTRKGVAAYHRKDWPRRTRCKEGNLAYFYDHYGYARYDVVIQLDADHVPQPGYLYEMLQPFRDPTVGYVSAPSICSQNEKTSWAARTRLHAEAMFHGVLQAGYSNGWAPMCIGSHYAVRTAALRDVGGLGPELAEDHSTSMLLNAGGWRGMHAMDAIAIGQGPANLADLVTQEFQWSRSLVTLLLSHTPRYFAALPPVQKFQFVFSQLWYPLFALFMAVIFALPVVALLFDLRFVDVSYLGFLGHVLPALIVLIVLAYMIRADGLFRPKDARVLGWEKAVFAALQWPWVLAGCIMALRDKLSGQFVDFRITPKGEAASPIVPWKVLLPYFALALISLAPVLLVENVSEAPGFYIFALVNASIYSGLFLLIVANHIRETPAEHRRVASYSAVQLVCAAVLGAGITTGFVERGRDAAIALASTSGDVSLIRSGYRIAGAGQGSTGDVHITYNNKWLVQLVDYWTEGEQR